jgi:hypothetical protein
MTDGRRSASPLRPSSGGTHASARERPGYVGGLTSGAVADRRHLEDRQLDAVLERLDRLCDEVHALNRRVESTEGLARIAHELTTLNESLQTLAYAALGQQGPQVRRRRSA